MSYCPATTNITILSLYNVCLQSNKLLLNSLHSLEICSTYGGAKPPILKGLALRFSTLRVLSGWELTDSHCCRWCHKWQKLWLEPGSYNFLNMITAPHLSPYIHRNGTEPTNLFIKPRLMRSTPSHTAGWRNHPLCFSASLVRMQ